MKLTYCDLKWIPYGGERRFKLIEENLFDTLLTFCKALCILSV